MPISSRSAVSTAIALSLCLGLAACGTTQGNSSLYSTKQPVVTRDNYTLDLATAANGLSVSEKQRLAAWFETLELGYGDRVAIDAPLANAGVNGDIAAIAGQHGVVLSEGAPVTAGAVPAGAVRVVVTRSHAEVPGCPEWSNNSGVTLGNKTPDGFGCAINSNLAAMVANPDHLLKGADGTGQTVVMTSNKAIATYRDLEPSGAGGLPEISSTQGAGQ